MKFWSYKKKSNSWFDGWINYNILIDDIYITARNPPFLTNQNLMGCDTPSVCVCVFFFSRGSKGMQILWLNGVLLKSLVWKGLPLLGGYAQNSKPTDIELQKIKFDTIG